MKYLKNTIKFTINVLIIIFFLFKFKKYTKLSSEKGLYLHILAYTIYTPLVLVINYSKVQFSFRYAFIKFSNAEDAIQTYKEKYNLVIDSRSVVLRFRRKINVNPPGQIDKLVSFYFLD